MTAGKSLADFMRESATNPFLLMGPPAPKPGWIYRDFRPMPRGMWAELELLLGLDQIERVGANSRQSGPMELTMRAQLWISPEAQERWKAYLRLQAH